MNWKIDDFLSLYIFYKDNDDSKPQEINQRIYINGIKMENCLENPIH